MHTKIDNYSDHPFVIYNASSLLPSIIFSCPFWGIACFLLSPVISLGKVQCTFTITEAQHLIYNLYKYPKTLCSHCCCCNVILNIYTVYMLTLCTLIEQTYPHTHMHNKMLCTSKDLLLTPPSFQLHWVAVHNCSIMFKMIQQKQGELAMHMSNELQSSSTQTQSVYLPLTLWAYELF